MGLQQFERRLERLVEGAFARAFRSSLRPVEVGRRLTREMDLQRTVDPRGHLLAPNRFTVALSSADRESFASFEDAMIGDLTEMAREHAKAEGYRFLGRVAVEVVTDDSLGPGRFLVAGEVAADAEGAPVGSIVLGDGTRIELGPDPVTIGRLPDCDVVVPDPNVSRRHAEIRRAGDDVVVVDLGSTNGTRVNGAGVKERRLDDGDVVTVGTAAIRFEAS